MEAAFAFGIEPHGENEEVDKILRNALQKSSEMEAAFVIGIKPHGENEVVDKIIRNALQKCKFEAAINMLQIPLKDIEERVAYYTGISKVKINQILEKSVKPIKADSIDFNFLVQILKSLYQFYVNQESPTFRNLFETVQKSIAAVQNYEHFKQCLMVWGFNYHTVFNDRILLMEDPMVTFRRYSYLKKIRQLRSRGVIIYYLSVRLIDKDQNFNTPRNQSIETSETSSGEYTFFHAISNTGFTNGLFSYTATEYDIFKWIVDILLGLLHPLSVVVLENSYLNGTSNAKSVSIYDTKQDMMKWLRYHNVPCSNTMNKSQLYELVKRHAVVEDMSRIEHALRAGGHEVLILPPYIECLSPVEFIWRDIKKNPLPSKDIHDNILSFFTKMPQETYQLYGNNVKERENELFTLEEDMDKAFESFLVNLRSSEPTTIKIE